MTNAEKYKKEIDKLVRPNEQAKRVLAYLAYNIKTNELTRCGAIGDCGDCLFSIRNNKDKVATCTENCKNWLQSKYEVHTEDTEKCTTSEDKDEDISEEPKIKKLLFVEDGSVAKSELYSRLQGHPEIAIIFYRPNSKTPFLINLEEEK